MKFRLIILWALLAFGLTGAALAQDENTLPNGVAAGDVTQTTAVLWAHSTAAGTVKFEYTNEDGSATGAMAVEVTDPLLPVKVNLSDLLPATVYTYTATDAAGTSASGTFRTPAAVGEKVGLRVGVSGDWRGELAPYPAIANVAERDLDFFIEHGDTIYADYPSPDVPLGQATTLEEYRRKHNEGYSVRNGLNTWAALRASTAVLATIDDHEVTNDFAGGAAPATDPRFAASPAEFINDTELYETGLQVFQEYNPLRDEFYGDTGDARTTDERKLYRYQTYGGDAAVFLLDARSFRDAEIPNPEAFTSEALTPFMAALFAPGRTMLGQAQFDDLKANLADAQEQGITWKFIIIPEPAQNMGPVSAGDRFEGYAAERAALMQFIVDSSITNVVFITADIHGTLVNNLTYQIEPGGEQQLTDVFEISTGAVAFDAPFGPTIVALAAGLDFITPQQRALYTNLPPLLQENFMKELINGQIEPFGYDLIGLEGSSLDATLVTGGYLATSSYGWTEFDIDAETQQLRVITYGIPYYTQAQATDEPDKILALTPAVVSEFTVNPK
ncbi:MAG TPA: alkaline phosphatase D family protein [Phototrophicaceae bacterium]|nr:alkaline phosphatase D family protein [Phototrophicaceae bacterium]